MAVTENLGLYLPDLMEQYSLEHWNGNSEKIDAAVAGETEARRAGDDEVREYADEVKEYATDMDNMAGVLTAERGGTGQESLAGSLQAHFNTIESGVLGGTSSQDVVFSVGSGNSPRKIALDDLVAYISRIAVPVGTVNAFYSDNIPDDWLLCDGSSFDTNEYPALNALLGTDVVPDMREMVLVGAGQCTTRNVTLAVHDVYTLGQFKDDQVQSHTHQVHRNCYHNVSAGSARQCMSWTQDCGDGASNLKCEYNSGRRGDTTHGKQLGVNYIIKAR